MSKILHRLSSILRSGFNLTKATAKYGIFALSIGSMSLARKLTCYGDADDILEESLKQAREARPFFISEMRDTRDDFLASLKNPKS